MRASVQFLDPSGKPVGPVLRTRFMDGPDDSGRLWAIQVVWKVRMPWWQRLLKREIVVERFKLITPIGVVTNSFSDELPVVLRHGYELKLDPHIGVALRVGEVPEQGYVWVD